MMCASAVQVAAPPGEVVSNTGSNKTFNGLDIRSNGGHPPCSRKAKASSTKTGDPYFCGINLIFRRDHAMITMSQTKSANYLFIVAVLKSMREGGVITLAEYERAKRYYRKLTGSDLVIAD